MKNFNLLVVDDNPFALRLLTATFENDYAVYTATDGLEALNVLHENKIDLVITDILMPNMDGYLLSYKIRTNEKLKDVPIVIYTASDISQSEEAVSKQMGANLYFCKPTSLKLLAAAVLDLLINPQKYPHAIPTKQESALMMQKYSVKLIEKLEQNNRELSETKEATEALNRQLQQKLKEIENYKNALDESSIVAITDQKGVIKYANELFCKVSKYEKAELIGQDHRMVNSGHHSKAFMKDLWATIAHGKVWKGEIKNKNKEGGFYWVHTTIVPFLNDHGKVVEYVSIRNEITEQKNAEESVKHSEIRLKQIQAIAQLGGWELDLINNTTHWSDEQFAIMGFKPEEVKPTNELFLSMVHPEDSERVNQGFTETFQTFKSGSSNFRLILKNGTLKYVYCEWRFELSAEQKPIRLYGIIQDNTDKKIAELQREFDKNNLHALINNVQDLIWSVDLEYKLITYNRPLADAIKFFAGTDIKAGANMLSYALDEKQAQIYKGFYDRAFAGEAFTQEEYTGAPANGWTEISLYPILSDGKIIGVACHSRDITERKKAENEIADLNKNLEERVQQRTAQLTEANKSLEAFSSMVSHDLQAPVRAVTGFSQIIMQDYGTKLDPQVLELFHNIESNGKRMSAIIQDLLKLAKYGTEKLKPESVNMTNLVEGIWLNISRTVPHTALLEMQPLPNITVDMSMIQQVVVNLLSNAIKYSSKKERPVVMVWFEQTKENVTFYFKDNGAGFDMKHYDRLFGAFQRLHSLRQFEGTGVGLTLVKRIIEKHGGKVGADAREGEGATFWFSLPVIAEN